MKQRFFIAGTDTSVGKTFIATKLLMHFNQQGLTTLGLKPVASGCKNTEQGLRNDDALQLQQASSIKVCYEQINPFAFAPPIAPHIAAEQQKTDLSIERIIHAQQDILQSEIDVILIEGCGGWLVPLNKKETFADLAKAYQLPVILVVAMRLGCLNHALLTAASIRAHGLTLAGWVANVIDADMPFLEENIEHLRQTLGAPQLVITS